MYQPKSVFTTGAIERVQGMNELARDILRLSRNTLLINLRFLDAALCKFVPSPQESMETLATDGQYLYYSLRHILRSYKRMEFRITHNKELLFHEGQQEIVARLEELELSGASV